ncbi:MAG: hypothetical protein E6H03_01495 [Bacillati bacterium ANGP1]|uniref:Tetracyclin repressor-like C-terminal domain-containing protein n=1 Tax=Candidatus Segetimicrobium genomatis TaxID=2569760 RepID=A0A537JML8_9BACT|nr:MAG: hypothetical protein E6H03_01495 [Terrabacteria group bacterium ANGP1]
MHPEFRRRLSAFFARWEESVDRGLRVRVARREFRRDLETRRMATALISQIEGAVLLMKAHRRADPIEAGLGTLLKFMESR